MIEKPLQKNKRSLGKKPIELSSEEQEDESFISDGSIGELDQFLDEDTDEMCFAANQPSTSYLKPQDDDSSKPKKKLLLLPAMIEKGTLRRSQVHQNSKGPAKCDNILQPTIYRKQQAEYILLA
ncbi:hypothetical protein PR048_032957 [Dryococelus australis]|uniref:Uncharacterized protein n=1 Tax=Dryococelus australis TaxID=614101 RepID=A0ABQ9G3Q3_9NEOP|nr:hypothetical protein PR048_032957 [Dryococelus australis]